MRKRGFITLFFIALLSHGTAYAAAITNLDDVPQTIELLTFNGYETVVIPPGSTWRVGGKAKVRYHGRELFIEQDMEFAIWKNRETGGDLGPQRHLKNWSRGSSIHIFR